MSLKSAQGTPILQKIYQAACSVLLKVKLPTARSSIKYIQKYLNATASKPKQLQMQPKFTRIYFQLYINRTRVSKCWYNKQTNKQTDKKDEEKAHCRKPVPSIGLRHPSSIWRKGTRRKGLGYSICWQVHSPDCTILYTENIRRKYAKGGAGASLNSDVGTSFYVGMYIL